MAERDSPVQPSTERAWFVYQLTEAEGHALCETSGMFMADSPFFAPLAKRVRQLMKSCGCDRYVLLDRSGCMFLWSAKKGTDEPPRNRMLLMEWAAEDRAKVEALQVTPIRVRRRTRRTPARHPR